MKTESLVDQAWEKKLIASECSVLKCKPLQKVEELLLSAKHQLSSVSRTARLWLSILNTSQDLSVHDCIFLLDYLGFLLIIISELLS